MWFRFWVGRDAYKYVDIDERGYSKKELEEEVKEQLDQWVERNYPHVEYVRYGYQKKRPPAAERTKLLQAAEDRVKSAKAYLLFLKHDFKKETK